MWAKLAFVHPIDRDLAEFYEEEAASGRRTPPHGPRVVFRARFIEALLDEGRRSVLEGGSGPGHERQAFADAGLEHLGIDLAVGNADLAPGLGATVIPASLYAPPFRSGAFDAFWSMSTLMHVPFDRFDEVMTAIVRVLAPGSPLGVGIWGSSGPTDREFVSEFEGNGTRRLFSLRTAATNEAMFAAHVTLECFEVHDELGPDDWTYHLVLARTPDGARVSGRS